MACNSCNAATANFGRGVGDVGKGGFSRGAVTTALSQSVKFFGSSPT